MKSHLSILPHTMEKSIIKLTNSAKQWLGLSVAVLLTMLSADKAQATDKVILATGNNLETTFGQMPSNSDGRGYDITTGEEFDPSSPTEAKNTAGGDPDITFFLNEMESKDFSKFSLEELNKRLASANERKLKPGADLKQKIRLGKLTINLESWITLAALRAENEAKTAEIAALDKEGNRIKTGQEATKAEIVGIKTGQEALDKELAKEKEKLSIVKNNSNP